MKWRVLQITGRIDRELEIAQFLTYPDARLFVKALLTEEDNEFEIELMDNVETKSI